MTGTSSPSAPSAGGAGWAPGQVLVSHEGPITTLAGAPRTTLVVVNTGDRPVQVGSHFHLAQANTALSFDRTAAHGMRLDVAAGTAVRFEPGVEREVVLVAIAGARVVPGLTVPAPGRLDGEALGAHEPEPGEPGGPAGRDAPQTAPGGFGRGDED